MNLPIAERELRVASRAPRTYRGRLLAAVIFGLIVAWFFWFVTKTGITTVVAAQTYGFVAYMALMSCVFSANATADTLSSEKRNGTLGLLFLTDLKGVDIVAGKMLAAGLNSFYGLLAILPMMAMPVLMGGISGESVFKTSLTLVNGLFLGLSIGIFISARSWDHKRAMNASVWIAMFFMWAIPGISIFVRQKYHWIEASDVILLFSPSYQMSHASPFGVGMIHDRYWTSFAITHGLAWLAILGACLRAPREWQDRPAGERKRGGWREAWHNFQFGSPSARAAFRKRLLAINAMHWLSAREKSAPVYMWVVVIAIVLGWIALWAWIEFAFGNGPPFWGLGVPAVMLMQVALRARTCGLVSEVIARDRMSGALELLLSTTLTEQEVARGQWLSFRRIIMGPAIFSVLVSLAIFLGGIMREVDDGDYTVSVFIFVSMVVLFVFDLIASVWTGMWMGCVSKTISAAAGNSVLRLLVAPWIMFAACMTVVAIFEIEVLAQTFPRVFSIWFAICFVTNLYWIDRARRRFFERLRTSAAERYQPPPGKWRWWRLDAPKSFGIGLSKTA